MLLDTARAGLKLAILIPLHFNLAQRRSLVTKLGLLYQNCLIKCLTFRVNTSVSQFHFVQYRVRVPGITKVCPLGVCRQTVYLWQWQVEFGRPLYLKNNLLESKSFCNLI